MKTNSTPSSVSASANRRDFRFNTPLFVRPSANRAAARARVEHSPFDDFWTPNLLDRLHAPLRAYRD
jgi:hypothetical protein